jgi:hypothetical protein
MTKTTSQVNQSAIILYGMTSIGKTKAGLFKGTEVPPALKAATTLDLRTLEISDPPGHSLAAKIPAGKIQGHGQAIVPFVPKHVYAAIESLARAKPSNGTGEKAGSQSSKGLVGARLPTNWDDIKVGDRVLAQDADPKDGWWQAKVVEKNGDLLRLRWPLSERGRPFQKHRFTVGLICPGAGETEQAVPSKPTDSQGVRFPKDWATIGLDQIVLAKEDGPCEQWWDAKTIKLDNDVFTLQWRDRPDLPLIVRPRTCLGLMHPAPKSR